ncbi:TetR/AcrR family transcriptional regulator [Vibrio vulnificus]|uniref:TetR/AcrR family transcriptional regulator n=1 Tax=Vibrio vulnificus TaxID=672 RepID=UPI001CDCAFE7|nr:TetR/AcrR family transcriptional regulator [Vibrio vulnificus]EGR0081844.1 TetR/AcrR family transcriptional regulator [Vibrio vulnificus]ELM6646412.1 TetR/AcrR family transcriptional regulator [Vibrio vulnificus]ELV8655476.1 TetR/AcrR family transcriptional regulator [Vibrio vulnificus]ELV8657623.1 TetR/AcrR family transcriptional regulator [Vibrio vulnificus]MCA3975971.1 TetR/AcrR family transcriptional regulator [Vibrio vulnificus]
MIEKKKTRSEEKREAILTAAKQAFLEFGVQNTSMDKLAALAGVSKRTVYNHFSSKEALVMELLSVLWKSTITEDELVALSKRPLQEQLVSLLCQEINVIAQPSYLDMAKVALGHFLFKPEELKAQTSSMSKQDTALYTWLAEQDKKGRLKLESVELARTQLHSLIKGSAFWPQLIGSADPLTVEQGEALAKNTAALFLSHYAVSEEHGK